MEYTVQFREEGGIVMAVGRGEWERSVDDEMVREIMQTVSETKCRKVLLDIRELEFDIPIVQIFQRAEEVREQRRAYDSKSARVAIVYFAKDEKMDQDMTFFENAAYNRGLPYRVFKDVGPALSWLAEDKA